MKFKAIEWLTALFLAGTAIADEGHECGAGKARAVLPPAVKVGAVLVLTKEV